MIDFNTIEHDLSRPDSYWDDGIVIILKKWSRSHSKSI